MNTFDKLQVIDDRRVINTHTNQITYDIQLVKLLQNVKLVKSRSRNESFSFKIGGLRIEDIKLDNPIPFMLDFQFEVDTFDPRVFIQINRIRDEDNNNNLMFASGDENVYYDHINAEGLDCEYMKIIKRNEQTLNVAKYHHHFAIHTYQRDYIGSRHGWMMNRKWINNNAKRGEMFICQVN